MGIVGEVVQWAKSLLPKSDREALFEALEDNRIARANLELQIRQLDADDRAIRDRLCQYAVDRRRPSLAGEAVKPAEPAKVIDLRAPFSERYPNLPAEIARAESFDVDGLHGQWKGPK